METESSLCQCCLKKSQNLPNVNFLPYLRMIQDCFSIEVSMEACDDGSRPILCKECIGILMKCHQFMTMIQESQFTLQMARTGAIDDTSDKPPIDNDYEPSFSPASPPHSVENSISVKYKCDVCQKTFQFHENLEYHLKNHTNYANGLFECDKCSKKFRFKESIEFHLRTHDALSMDGEYECTACSDKFHALELFNDHMEQHRRWRPTATMQRKHTYECESCSKVCRGLAAFEAHVEQSHAGVRYCRLCRKLQPEDTFETHKHTRRRCQVRGCSERFRTLDDRSLHMRDAHSINIDKYKCDVCPAKFHRRPLLKRHMNAAHPAESVNICEVCGFQCKRVNQLRMHMLIHYGTKKHVCPVCSKAFLRRKNLSQHARIHYNHKVYKCHRCSDGFNYRVSLRQHLMKVHNEVLT